MPDHITYDYDIIEGDLSPAIQQSAIALYEKVFASPGSRISDRLKRKDLVTVLAKVEGQMVGFKVGYPEKKLRFYSWLGYVHPAYRRQGIARELMHQQHRYCCEAGFTTVRTKTTNRWRSMLLLNIRNGFDVVGTYLDDHKELKIILEKNLNT